MTFSKTDIEALIASAQKNPAALLELTEAEQADAARAIFRLQDERYAKDAYQWALDHVRTVDEASGTVLPFPDRMYLRDLFDALDQEKRLALPKSRRMFVTWAVSIFMLHRIRFRKHFAAFIQSDTETKAAYIIDKRMKFVEDNIVPIYRRAYTQHKGVGGFVTKMAFGDSSYVQALAQGADSFRTYTPTMVFMDEIESMEQGHQSFVAALPFLEKNCQMVLCSSSKGPHGVLADFARELGFTRFQ